MSNKLRDFLPLQRRFFKHWLWTERRVYNKAEAWIDILQSTRWKSSSTKRLLHGRLVSWRRGEWPASRRFLQNRWQWSAKAVSSFLELLEQEQMIVRVQRQGQTIIRVCKYKDYNIISGTTQETTEETTEETTQYPENTDTYEENGSTRDPPRDQPRDYRGTIEGPLRDQNRNTGVKQDGKQEEKQTGKQKALGQNSANFDPQWLALSRDFHQFQHTQHPTLLKTVDEKLVEDGAEVLDKLHRLDKEPVETIQEVLRYAARDDFWSTNLISLRGIRTKGKNGQKKYFNIKASMIRSNQTPQTQKKNRGYHPIHSGDYDDL